MKDLRRLLLLIAPYRGWMALGALLGLLTLVANVTLLATSLAEQAICLVTIRPTDVETFGDRLRALAERGVVTRVEAEPHL